MWAAEEVHEQVREGGKHLTFEIAWLLLWLAQQRTCPSASDVAC